MSTAWTPELKEQVIADYQAADPTPATSTEIIKDIAEKIEMSPNGVRMVLSQAGVYVKKEAGSSSKTTAKDKPEGAKRVSKESAIAELREAIEAAGKAVDDDILGKLTGKAAVYLLGILN